MNIDSIKAMLTSACVTTVLVFGSCNVDVKKGDANTADSSNGSGISVQVIKDGDTLVGKQEPEVQHIDRPADSGVNSRKNNNK